MYLSSSTKYQKAKDPEGFIKTSVDNEDQLWQVMKYDWSPVVFKNGHRAKENFESCEWLFADVDNSPGDVKCSIERFKIIFEGIEYYLGTSRNHQKEKSGKPAADRFHVLFPVSETYKKHEDLTRDMRVLIQKYPFMDDAAKDAARFFYGHSGVSVFHNSGAKICITHETSDVMTSLRNKAAQGAFDDYAEWLKLGIALRRSGYTVQDWIELSNAGQEIEICRSKWDSFDDSGDITEGTIFYLAGINKRSINGFVSTKQPTKLLPQVNRDEVERIMSQLWYKGKNKDGEDVQKLKPDWYFEIIKADPAIANCVKFDYTIGVPVHQYASSRILESSLIRRIIENGVPAPAVTARSIELILGRVEMMNDKHNRVADFVDMMKEKHPETDDSLLDKFLSFITWEYQRESDDMDSEAYAKMCEETDSVYRELFDKFFLRMHMHINGTRKNEHGEYLGLIENDIVPILGGLQGLGKTALCHWIAVHDDFYVDVGSGGKMGFGTADTIRKVRGKLIAELGEMKIMKSDEDVEQVKSFISMRAYELDIKFQENVAPLPATVSYMGTSNPSQYLIDDTDNRRFFPIQIAAIDKEGLGHNAELAEKIHAHYARKAEKIVNGDRFEKLKFSNMLMSFMDKKRANAMVTYSDYEAIKKCVPKWMRETMRIHSDWDEEKICVTSAEIEKIVKDMGYVSRVGKKGIQKAMKEIGFVQDRRRDNESKVTEYGWYLKKREDKKEPEPQQEIPF